MLDSWHHVLIFKVGSEIVNLKKIPTFPIFLGKTEELPGVGVMTKAFCALNYLPFLGDSSEFKKNF